MVSAYIGAMLIGLFHGLEPGHGWPIAALYSLKKQNKYLFGLISALIISFFHFFSSIIVVIAFMFLKNRFNLGEMPILRYIAGVLLLYMAYKFWTDHSHSEKTKVGTLKEIAIFAFVLGFAHQEEFALLAFCLNNVNCLLLMILYASAVTVSLITLTMLSIKAYEQIEQKMHNLEHLLPKISAVILFVLAVLYFLNLV